MASRAGIGTELLVDPAGVSTVYAALYHGSVWQASPPVPVELSGFSVE